MSDRQQTVIPHLNLIESPSTDEAQAADTAAQHACRVHVRRNPIRPTSSLRCDSPRRSLSAGALLLHATKCEANRLKTLTARVGESTGPGMPAAGSRQSCFKKQKGRRRICWNAALSCCVESLLPFRRAPCGPVPVRVGATAAYKSRGKFWKSSSRTPYLLHCGQICGSVHSHSNPISFIPSAFLVCAVISSVFSIYP